MEKRGEKKEKRFEETEVDVLVKGEGCRDRRRVVQDGGRRGEKELEKRKNDKEKKKKKEVESAVKEAKGTDGGEEDTRGIGKKRRGGEGFVKEKNRKQTDTEREEEEEWALAEKKDSLSTGECHG